MSLLFAIGRLLSPVAHAGTLDTAGAGAAGVNDMWRTIRSTLLGGRTVGPMDAVAFFTGRITAFVLSIIGVVAVGLVMYAGIRMMTGGEEGMTEAKKIIMMTLIGLGLAMIAGAAIGFIIGILQALLS